MHLPSGALVALPHCSSQALVSFAGLARLAATTDTIAGRNRLYGCTAQAAEALCSTCKHERNDEVGVHDIRGFAGLPDGSTQRAGRNDKLFNAISELKTRDQVGLCPFALRKPTTKEPSK